MNIVAFIPARAGSKSIPKKNIKLLGGKPLIAYSIESAFRYFSRVIVNTDGEEIAAVAREYGAEVMMRPSNLAEDKTSMFEVLRSEIFKIDPLPDAVILLHPTTPFRKGIQIRIAMELFENNLEKYDSLVAVEAIPEKYHPMLAIISAGNGSRMIFGKLMTLGQKIKAMFGGKRYTGPVLEGIPISHRVTRRQEHPDAFVPTGTIYLFKTSNLKKGSIYGDKVLLMQNEPAININSLQDFEEAEQWLKSSQK